MILRRRVDTPGYRYKSRNTRFTGAMPVPNPTAVGTSMNCIRLRWQGIYGLVIRLLFLLKFAGSMDECWEETWGV
jgi:hypothetical protein